MSAFASRLGRSVEPVKMDADERRPDLRSSAFICGPKTLSYIWCRRKWPNAALPDEEPLKM